MPIISTELSIKFYPWLKLIQFPGWFMTLYGIFSQFSSQKSRERIMFVGRGENLKKLYDEIPEKYLPEDLGGEIKAANQKQWVKRLEMVSKQVRSKWGEDCNLFGLSNCQFLRSKKTFRT